MERRTIIDIPDERGAGFEVAIEVAIEFAESDGNVLLSWCTLSLMNKVATTQHRTSCIRGRLTKQRQNHKKGKTKATRFL